MISKSRMLWSGLGLLGSLLVVALVYEWWTGAPPTAAVAQVEGTFGSYAALAPAQQRLVDDWVARFGKTTGKALAAGEMYDSLPLSTRTTFAAVTHALARTPLSDDNGPMNLTALDLVAKIDGIAGSIPGKGGDQQFRMYVELRPNAQQILERSREFARQVDNTIYHKGFPICFRGAGGTPSIQFSMSVDASRGDIDVDYRSSSFPIMLINGHLTASNSDVRAGNNDERHNGQWAGLRNWWRGFMGLTLGEATSEPAVKVAGAVSKEPRLGKGAKPEDAIADFLSAWLVERKPEVAVGYISARAYSCLEVENGRPVDRGMAPFQIARAMASAAARVGQITSLADATSAVSLSGERSREIAQPHREAFAMYDVREDLATAFDCENTLHPELADPKRASSTKFGKYLAAVFRLRPRGRSTAGEAVATLWTQENHRWALVSYDVEPEFRPATLPSASAAGETSNGPVATAEGDAAMTRAATRFFDAWFVRDDTAAAFSYFSPQALGCYNLYRPDDAPEARSANEAAAAIRERMKWLDEWAGPGKRLEDVLAPAEPHHADLRLVKHDRLGAFAIVAVPDSLGSALECSRMKRGEAPKPGPATAKAYGRFFATSSRLRRAGEDAATLWTLWESGPRDWKIVSFLVVTP